MLRNLHKQAVSLVVFIACFSSAVLAAEPEKISQSGVWTAYVLKEGSGKICYMVSQPKDAKGNYSNRGDVFALITHRPAENTRDVFSYIAGYGYKPGSKVTLSVDGKENILLTQDDTAWAPDDVADAQIAKAIKAGSKMVVQGTSSRGTLTTDEFSLKGASAAYKEISKACGIR